MLDTNMVSALIKTPHGSVADAIARIGTDRICLSIMTAAELRYGARRKGSQRLSAAVDGVLLRMAVLDFVPPADAVYAEIRDRLTKAGTSIGPVDTFIAAHALSLDLTLVTANIREFSRVPGLKLENWLD